MAKVIDSEAKIVLKTSFKGRTYEVGFVKREEDFMQGWIDGGKKRIGFSWRPSKYTETPAVYEADFKNPKVVAFVAGILKAVSDDSISDNHPGGGGRTMDNWSKLIKKGHVRKACWHTKDGDKHGILVNPCIVNGAKMTAEELKDAEEYVAFYKTLLGAQTDKRPLSHKEVMEAYKG